MVGGIDNVIGVALVVVLLAVVGSSKSSVPFCPSWSYIASLVPLPIAFLSLSFLIAIIGEIAFLSTVETRSFAFAPVFFTL